MARLQQCFAIVVIACLVSNGLATSIQAFDGSNALAIHSRQRRSIHDIKMNLINELVANLQRSAAEATQSIADFTTAMGEEARLFNEQLQQGIDNLKASVQQAVDEAIAKAEDVAAAVYECVENERENAESLFNSTISDVTSCVTQRLDQFADQLSDLAALSSQSAALADQALKKAQQCGLEWNIIAVGACLTGVLVETKVASVNIAAQTGLLIARINIAVNSLPVTLSVCAGTRLAETALRVAAILLNIGQCAVTSVVTTV